MKVLSEVVPEEEEEGNESRCPEVKLLHIVPTLKQLVNNNIKEIELIH